MQFRKYASLPGHSNEAVAAAKKKKKQLRTHCDSHLCNHNSFGDHCGVMQTNASVLLTSMSAQTRRRCTSRRARPSAVDSALRNTQDARCGSAQVQSEDDAPLG